MPAAPRIFRGALVIPRQNFFIARRKILSRSAHSEPDPRKSSLFLFLILEYMKSGLKLQIYAVKSELFTAG
jgi:hypothetical protein